MQAEHTLERKGELEVKCAEQTTLLLEKDAEIVHLKSLLSLKEAVVNYPRVETLESVATSKEIELASLSSQVATLTADLSGFQLSRDELNSKLVSLECVRDYLATQVEKMQDEQVRVLSDRVAAIDSDLVEMVLHMDAEFYPRYLTTIAGRRWILSRGPKLVLAKCLSSPEYLSAMGEAIGRAINKDVAAFNPFAKSDYVVAVNALQGVSFLLLSQLEDNKDASMADVMDLLYLEGPAAETSEASQLQPSLDQLMILIHRLEDQVEPLSARKLIGEPSASADLTTAVTTALSTTFVQTYLILTVLSTEVPPHPKIVFEEEELDTTPEHDPAP
ncbi:hypothetical protein Tco_0928625 [Tanacetum coccineum]